MLTWWGIMHDVLDRYAIRRWGTMLTWWGIMLDVADTPDGGEVLLIRHTVAEHYANMVGYYA